MRQTIPGFVGMVHHSAAMEMLERPRRNRKSPWVREMHRETWISANHFIYPLFIHGADDDVPIASMPGQRRLSPNGLLHEVEAALQDGIGALVLFPKVDDQYKSRGAERAYDDAGLIPTSVREIKARWPDLTVVTDVALDPYSSDGHDGIVRDGRVVNDETVEILVRQALSQARSGADIISPSDMMDGRVGAIREALDEEGFTDVSILAYTAKYASAFYGPFRDALDSHPKPETHGQSREIPQDKRTYQMDPANVREALREVDLDEDEGADMVMVKPAGPYLDVIRRVREHTNLPVAAYQVSGEYAMLKAASANGWLDERAVALESLLAIRRAGADCILTYYAREAARWLREG